MKEMAVNARIIHFRSSFWADTGILRIICKHKGWRTSTLREFVDHERFFTLSTSCWAQTLQTEVKGALTAESLVFILSLKTSTSIIDKSESLRAFTKVWFIQDEWAIATSTSHQGFTLFTEVYWAESACSVMRELAVWAYTWTIRVQNKRRSAI